MGWNDEKWVGDSGRDRMKGEGTRRNNGEVREGTKDMTAEGENARAGEKQEKGRKGTDERIKQKEEEG